MPEFMRIIEEKNDKAQVIEALSHLVEQASGTNARVQFAMQMSSQLHALEMEHAQANQEIQEKLFDLYESRVETLSQERSFLSFITLGLFGSRSWEECCSFAREEIVSLLTEIRKAQSGQVIHAVAARLPLFEFVLGSREGALNLAESLLQTLAPEEYQMLQQIASSSGGHQQNSSQVFEGER